MAKLAMVYGVRLLPADELESVEEAKIKLKNGPVASVAMHLIEGAKWSDGEPFTADDPMFYWQILHDTNISPLNGATLATFGEGTTLEAKDPYTLVWTFKEAFPKQYLFNMAYGTFCPGPAHLLKPLYPKNSGKTYDEYKAIRFASSFLRRRLRLRCRP